MPDTDFDDIETLDDEESENHVRIGKADLKKVRDAAKESRALRRELDGIKRERAVTAAGLTDLNTDQTAALAVLVEDPTPENLRSKAEALGWVQPAPPDPDAVTDAELDQHAQVAAVGTGAANVPANPVLTNEEYASWPIDKRMRFQDQHPQTVEALMREDPQVRLPAGFI